MGRQKPFYDWPIPDHRHRLVDFVGEAFLIGAAGVSAYQFVRGLRGAPSGGRLAAGAHAVRANTPRVVGSFAAFSAVYCAAECAVSVARGGKEDTWNSIAAGAAAAALKHSRRGAFGAARAGLIGASAVAAAVGVFHIAFEWLDHTTPSRRTTITTGPLAPVATAQLPPPLAHWRSVVDKDVPT
ncbi:hypothetical protein PR202_ga08645 [Eleusine coracana subsp. coracana]|uniref:Uncharacterized protein n=1 Tax=Eleusine coracana subsp. coracana TaxID=191504 RepID=A0AAV5C0J6_ELECO|nr:hypothetical protein QOZ80_1BG0092900 [Eleusine coracana subsp. coracana]GJM92204.1 hypothetical protein PR202_ga08645 [Eleusine coracana subsp. coracana]